MHERAHRLSVRYVVSRMDLRSAHRSAEAAKEDTNKIVGPLAEIASATPVFVAHRSGGLSRPGRM
jgi:hypothetical protein